MRKAGQYDRKEKWAKRSLERIEREMPDDWDAIDEATRAVEKAEDAAFDASMKLSDDTLGMIRSIDGEVDFRNAFSSRVVQQAGQAVQDFLLGEGSSRKIVSGSNGSAQSLALAT